MDKNKRLCWEISKDSEEDLHLKLQKAECEDPDTNKIIDCLALRIDINSFFSDLLLSIDELKKDALEILKLRETIITAASRLSLHRPFNSVPPYVKSDLQNIKWP